MIRVVVIDDNSLVRTTLRVVIDRYQDLEVVGEANCGETGLNVVVRTEPDVVIVDSAMPGIDGAETTKRLLRSMPLLRAVGYSGDASNEAPLLEAGAVAFVLKGAPVAELVTAIRHGEKKPVPVTNNGSD